LERPLESGQTLHLLCAAYPGTPEFSNMRQGFQRRI
jgi:hypothetical protein